jgi:hypothetical protein
MSTSDVPSPETPSKEQLKQALKAFKKQPERLPESLEHRCLAAKQTICLAEKPQRNRRDDSNYSDQ